MQAKATESNVINQPFASRSSDGWRSQTLTRGGRKLGEVAGGHETTAPAMPPITVAQKSRRDSPPQSEMWRDAACSACLQSSNKLQERPRRRAETGPPRSHGTPLNGAARDRFRQMWRSLQGPIRKCASTIAVVKVVIRRGVAEMFEGQPETNWRAHIEAVADDLT